MKIVIIGAGLGGLTFGALASKDGTDVLIIDKNKKPGGVVSLFEDGDYKFEQGPLILGDILPGEPLAEFLSEFGIKLPTVRADRGTVTKDYSLWKPEEFKGYYWRREELKKLFPEDERGIDEYYKFYDSLVKIRHLSSKKDALSKVRLALEFLKIKKYKDLTAEEFVDKLFKNEKIKIVFTGIIADYCADPKECTCLMIPFINIETAFDVRSETGISGGFAYFDGGCQKLPKALAEFIESKGGKIRYNTVVSEVITENGKATAVKLENGEIIKADLIVGCGSAKDFFSKTVKREALEATEKGREYLKIVDGYRAMESVFMLHLAVDFDPLDYQPSALCYYYGDYDLSRAIADLRSGKYHEGRDGYLVSVPTWHAKDFAPEGQHLMTIYTIAPDVLADGTWEEKSEVYADKLLALTEEHFPGLRSHILYKKVITSDYYRDLMHQSKGSFGGAVPAKDVPLPPHKTPIENLVFVGAQSENGGGISAVIFGAKAAYENL